jgi:L-threonylcarbamoyladenylate synthase
MLWKNTDLVKTLKGGGVVVMPTDTLYGILGLALSEPTVERIYKLRKRSPDKPCIILIGDISEFENFSVKLTKEQKVEMLKYWPGPVSIVLDCADKKFAYLHRGTKTLAFRIPAILGLRELLLETGPLIAPSANTEGLPPSENVEEAKMYFGDKVDLYIDGGVVQGKASKVIRLNADGSGTVIRG